MRLLPPVLIHRSSSVGPGAYKYRDPSTELTDQPLTRTINNAYKCIYYESYPSSCQLASNADCLVFVLPIWELASKAARGIVPSSFRPTPLFLHALLINVYFFKYYSLNLISG